MNSIVTRKTLAIVAVFCLLQAAAIYFSNITQSSDAAAYLELAEAAIKNQSWYPAVADVHADYIFAPGYVNYLVLLLGKIGLDVKSALYFNIVFNVILLAATCALAQRLFSRRVAVIAGLIFITYLTNYGVVLLTLSDQLFCVFCYCALVLLFRKSWLAFAAAGVLLGLANWVRPLAVIFLIGSLLLSLLNRKSVRDMACIVAGYALVVGLIGGINYYRMGYFVSGSTTGGVNLIIGANDDMTGGYTHTVFEPGKIGYREDIDSLTFEQRDEFFKSRAKQWILAHPLKYVSYMPVKLFKLYGTDHFFVGPLTGNYNMAALEGKSQSARLTYFAVVGVNQIYYIALLLAAIGAAIWSHSNRRALWILSAIVVMGAGVNLLTYGAPRYHYPFMMLIIIMSSVALDAVLSSNRWMRRRGRPAALGA